jgi:hypothetical protein
MQKAQEISDKFQILSAGSTQVVREGSNVDQGKGKEST